MTGWKLDRHSVATQMVLHSVVLVALTAVAIGIPTTWFVRQQLNRQAWNQVERGGLAVRALYAAHQDELHHLAILTAQRPTLHQLLVRGERDPLFAYLTTLQQSLAIDWIAVYHPDGQPLVQTGTTAPEVDLNSVENGYQVDLSGPEPLAWLLAQYPLNGIEGHVEGYIGVGLLLDREFVSGLRDRTGLEQNLWTNGQLFASSLVSPPTIPCPDGAGAAPRTFQAAGSTYYGLCIPLSDAGLQAEVLLDVSDVRAIESQFIGTLSVSILIIIVLASLLGVVWAGRISHPLAHLVQAASAMQEGELARSLAVETPVREVAALGEALERVRVDLQLTLAELRREKDWTDHLLEAIVEGIVTLDRRGRITFFSHGAEQITGWRRDEVLGKTCDQVFRVRETDSPFSQLIPAPGRRRKISVELRDGRQAILAVTGARLLPSAGGDARVALVFRDISEEEAVHRLLGQFLANVAHEFRTPLSALAASVELLIDQAPELSAAELGELLGSLHLGVLGLQRLIDNLLECASLETGHFRVHPRPSHLNNILAEAIRTLQPLLDKRHQRLVIGWPAVMPPIYADPRRTVQVLVNLLSNASQYGPDEAEIQVGAAVKGDWVRVTIADSGPGVPEEYRADLFRRFARPHPEHDRGYGGVGLGLSVVKGIVEAHGGQVGVENRPGGGAVFWFSLPVANADTTEEDSTNSLHGDKETALGKNER